MYSLHLRIDGLPKTMNQRIGRAHWAIFKKDADYWKTLVAAHVGSKRPEKPLTKAVIVLTRHSSREPDFDGLVSTWKNVLDGLVICGIIQDDKPSVIGVPTIKWEKAPMGKGFITVEVYESNSIT